MKKLIAIILMCLMAFASVSAEAAKRMGGGKSVGQQSSNVSKKQAAPPTQATPPTTAAAPAATRPWGAMLGGLAAGLGLAWLASSLGLGAAFGNILMALVIGAAVLFGISWFMRKRMAGNNSLAYQGAAEVTASAQPTRFSGSSQIGSAISSHSTWTVPVGFDVVGFESAAKQNFILLQSAWDRADTVTLGTMMTDHMLAEMQSQLLERDNTEQHRTAVVSIESKLLGIEETADQYVASVEFTGVIQETVGEPAESFTEVWNMTKSKSAGGWLLAGIQTI